MISSEYPPIVVELLHNLAEKTARDDAELHVVFNYVLTLLDVVTEYVHENDEYAQITDFERELPLLESLIDPDLTEILPELALYVYSQADRMSDGELSSCAEMLEHILRFAELRSHQPIVQTMEKNPQFN